MLALLILCAAASGATFYLGVLRQAGAAPRGPQLSLRDRMTQLGDRIGKGGNENEMAARKQLLVSAGYRDDEALNLFNSVRLISAGLGIVFGIVMSSMTGSLMILIFGGVGGFFLPTLLLRSRAQERRAEVEKGLPEAVDLLVNCMDAGLGFEQALARVAEELGHSQPTLADELSVTMREFEAAIPVAEAMRRLSRRVGSEPLDTLCALVAQASELGAPMNQSLREYAAAARRKRVANLDEQVGKVSAKMTFPLLLCLIPAALLVVIGPTIIQLMDFFKGGGD